MPATLKRTVDLGALQDEVRRFNAYMADPHPGLMTWNEAFGGCLARMHELLCSEVGDEE